MNERFDVVVVGAGITGASTAYHLMKRGGLSVLLLEREAPAAGGTGKSAAIIRQHYSSPVLSRLTAESIEIFRAMPDELDSDGGYVASGWCFLLPADLRAGAEANIAMQREVGIDTRFLDAAEIPAHLPEIAMEGIDRVAYEVDGGYADPVTTTEAFVAGFRALGGTYRQRQPARRLLREGNRVTGIETDDERVAAGTVVNAAGPWARALAEDAGLSLPLRAVREQDTVWEVRSGRPLPTVSVSNAVDAIYFRPLGERRFVIGRGFPKDYQDVDPQNYKLTADEDFIAEVQARAEARFPAFAGMTLIGSYAALYDVTPDWYPFYGPRSEVEGYVDGSGGSGHGFKLGPAAGRALAGWIVDGRTDQDFQALSHDRVAEGRLFTQAYGGNRG